MTFDINLYLENLIRYKNPLSFGIIKVSNEEVITMAFVPNDTQQISFNDSTFGLTDREKKFLEKSWAKIFAEKIFPTINEDDYAPLYSCKASRPNTPVNVIIGALILKEILGVTDDEIVQGLMFDIRYQYALHTTSFAEQPLSDRSLSRFRARCLTYETETGIDLIHNTVIKLSKQIAEIMKISPNMQRMDSLMVAANIRNLSLLELFYTCVANLAKVMKERKISFSENFHHYIEKDDYNRFIYHQRNLDANERTIVVMHDAEYFLSKCNGELDDTSEYQLLIRLLKEQTIIDNGSRRLREKKEKEEPSKVLINPSDPEITVRRKAGLKHFGYVGNLVESVGEESSVITDYAYEQNIYSDNQFMKDYLNQQEKQEEEALLVADGAYSGLENKANAASLNINLVTTNFTGKKPDEIYKDFVFTDDKKNLIQCANNQHPNECVYDSGNDRSVAYFSLEVCNNCPYKEQCNPRFLKAKVRKEVSWKAVERAIQLQYMNTKEFIKFAHFRNGVEALPSLLRRRYHVDKIPAHGKKQTKLFFGFKIAALNFQKLFDYLNSLEQCTLNPELG